MQQRSRFRFFVSIAAVLSLFNLLVINDLATAWSGAEARLLLRGLNDSDPYFLPAWTQSLLTGDLTFQLFLSRLPGVVLIVAAGAVFFAVGRRIFGDRTTTLTLLAWGGALLIPNIGKLAVSDLWLFFFQLLGWTTTLRYLKQPREQWRIATFISLLFALWLHPLSTILFFSVGSAWLYRFHPDGDRLRLINPWILLAAGGLSLFILNQWSWTDETFLLAFGSISYPRYLLIVFLSFLPLLGFFLGGLRDTARKLRKREELAIITSAWLIGGLAGQSLLLAAGVGLIVAKQLMLYFQPNYPHRSLVRAGALLHLVVAFCGITWMMLYSISEFGGIGFRSALAVGATYWMLSFVAVIGLFGPNRRLTWGGSLLSGLLFSLVFWVQYYPLIESRRNWPQRLEAEAQSLELDVRSKLYIHQLPAGEKDKAQLYCEPLFRKIIYTEDKEQLLEFYQNDPGNAFFIPRATAELLEEIKDSTAIRAWTDALGELDYLLIRN